LGQYFAGSRLNGGLSLRQAQLVDNFGARAQTRPSGSFAEPEVTDDWSRVGLDELERDCIGTSMHSDFATTSLR
jgi:hypothetical protein